MTWSVRLNSALYESGGTGFQSEEFARSVFEKLCDRVKAEGGEVELLRNGEVVTRFLCEPGGKPTQ